MGACGTRRAGCDGHTGEVAEGMLDRRGPVYAQGTALPDRRWIARAFGADGRVRGIAKRVTEAEAKAQAERWARPDNPIGAVRTEAVEGTGTE